MKKLLIYILIINFYSSASAQEKKITNGISVGTLLGIGLNYSIYCPIYYKFNENFFIESGLSNSIARKKVEYTYFQHDGSEVVEKTNKKIIRFYMPGIPVTMSYKLKNFYFGAGLWLNYKFSESVIFKGTDYRYTTDNKKIYTNVLLKVGWQHKLTNQTVFFTEVFTIPVLSGHSPVAALILLVGIKLNNKVLKE